ncbi:MAG TPA: glycosyltransferase family 4 protein [Dehalococcoidia bacterium]
MRICFLLHQGNMHSGGQGVYLHHVTRQLARMGHEVHAVVGPPYPLLDGAVHVHRLETYNWYSKIDVGDAAFWGRPPASYFHPLNFYELASSRAGFFSVMAAFSLRAFHTVRRLHAQHPFDLVHDNQSLGYGSLLLKLSGLPVVANVHHPLKIDRMNAVIQARNIWEKVGRIAWYPFWMQEVVARRLDRIITGSQASAQSVQAWFRLAPGRLRVILDGVDTDVFRPLEVPREPDTILYVGNSEDRNKGVRFLLEALAILRDQGVSFRLTLVDGPPERLKWVPYLLERFRLADRVRVTGRLSQEELVRTYNSAALFVCPSVYEGFGLPAAEAQACGTAVVATTAGALPEVVEDGVTGILVPPSNPQALARAIRALLEDPERRLAMGQAGQERIQRLFTWRETARQTAALYQEVLEEHGRRAR